MSKLLKEIAYVLDNDEMTAVTGLEPGKIIEIQNIRKIYRYLLITPDLIPYTQKDNGFWYDRNLVEKFIKDSAGFGVYLPDKEAPLLVRDYKKRLTFLVAPDGGT